MSGHDAMHPHSHDESTVAHERSTSLNAIETEDLTKRFRPVRGFRDLVAYRWREPTHPAVESVSLTVRRGELFGLLGENGAGKSTLIRMLSTTLLPTSGSARVLGHDVVREPHAVRRVIGLVSGDERSFFWRLTGRQNLRYFAALYHVPDRTAGGRITELMEMLGVSEYADQRYAALSTGTRQKFALARGMLTDPDVLFLDEPTRALDPIAAEELRRHIREHVVERLGRTVILATHTLAEAESACDRVAILRDGRLIELGTVEELAMRTEVADVVVIDVARDAADVAARLASSEGVIDATAAPRGGTAEAGGRDRGPGATGGTIEVRLATDPGAMAQVLRVLADSPTPVTAITTRRPTLADIYRATYAA